MAHKDWLFEKYNNDDILVFDSSDEDEEDDAQIARFMPSHLISEIGIQESLANIMQRASKNTYCFLFPSLLAVLLFSFFLFSLFRFIIFVIWLYVESHMVFYR